VTLVNGVITPELRRQVSETTRASAKEWDNPEFADGAPNVKFIRHNGIPPELHSLSQGRYDLEHGFVVSDVPAVCDGVESANGLVLICQKQKSF
jgi:hypothetical protein